MRTSDSSDSSDASLHGMSSSSTACSLCINFSSALWPRDEASASLGGDVGVGVGTSLAGESGNLPGIWNGEEGKIAVG